MAVADSSGRPRIRGWVAPRGGGYRFGAGRRDGDGRSVAARPPRGSGGVGNLNRAMDDAE